MLKFHKINSVWHNLLQHFQTLEQRPVERMAILVGGLVFFWMMEGSIPLRINTYKKNKLSHAGVNFLFTTMHLFIHTLLAVLIVFIASWCSSQAFGIVHWFQTGIISTIMIVVLALDFSSWLVHFVMHKSAVLWHFHLVHHSDTNVDVTTGLRHHPGDSLLRGCFFIVFIFFTGAPMYAVMIYQTLVVIATAFTHANISLPMKLDKLLSYVIISPNMHKVHHHWKQPYTDSNYGAVFSIWDRLFGTFKKLEIKNIKYGLDKYYPADRDENFLALLKKPFQRL